MGSGVLMGVDVGTDVGAGVSVGNGVAVGAAVTATVTVGSACGTGSDPHALTQTSISNIGKKRQIRLVTLKRPSFILIVSVLACGSLSLHAFLTS